MKVVLDHFSIPADMQMQMLHDFAIQEHEAGLGVVDRTIDAHLQSTLNDTQKAA